jgi:hypothetical protein
LFSSGIRTHGRFKKKKLPLVALPGPDEWAQPNSNLLNSSAFACCFSPIRVPPLALGVRSLRPIRRFRAGFTNMPLLNEDHDLDPIRTDAAFTQLVGEAKKLDEKSR